MAKHIITASKKDINSVLEQCGKKRVALISIKSPGENHALNFGDYKDFLPALFLSFDDASDKDPKTNPITEEQADQIAMFVIAWSDVVDMFICQCEAGYSRSAGVAAAIAYIFELDDTDIYKGNFPNVYVKSAVVHAYNRFREQH